MMPRTRRSRKNLPSLPTEVWIAIFGFAQLADLPNLALCSRNFHSIALPILYEDIEITNQHSNCDRDELDGALSNTLPLTRAFHSCTNGLSLLRFARVLAANPQLCRLVKSVHFNTTGSKDNLLLYALSHLFESGSIHLGLRCNLDLFVTGTPFNLTSLQTHCGRTDHMSPLKDRQLAKMIRDQPTLRRLYLTCYCHCPHFERADCQIDKPLNIEHLAVSNMSYHRKLFQEIVQSCTNLQSLYCSSEALLDFTPYENLQALTNMLAKHAETLETLYIWGFNCPRYYSLPRSINYVTGMEPLKRFTSLKRLCIPANFLIYRPRPPGQPTESPSVRRDVLRDLPVGLEEFHLQILLGNDSHFREVTEELIDSLRYVIENKIANRTPHLDSVVLWTTAIHMRSQRIIQPFNDTPETEELRKTYLQQGTRLSFWGGDCGPLFKDSNLRRLQAESFGYSGCRYTLQDYEQAVCSMITPHYTWSRRKPQPRPSWDDLDGNPEFYRHHIARGQGPTISFEDRTPRG